MKKQNSKWKAFFTMLLVCVCIVSCGSNDDGDLTPPSSNGDTGLLEDVNGHDYVDLGLSVNWATMNIGATETTGSGDQFAWGETTSKSSYSWANYKYGSSAEDMTKYNVTDGKTVLEATDDAAAVHWGGPWRMPTKKEFDELLSYCTWQWYGKDNTEFNGMCGYKILSNRHGYTDKFIFLPLTDYSTSDNGWAVYWSSTGYDGGNTGPSFSPVLYSLANSIIFSKSGINIQTENRYQNKSVRAVFTPKNKTNPDASIIEEVPLSSANLFDVGKVIGVKNSKGYIYSNTTVAAQYGAIPSAMIAYISSVGHGTAVALMDAGPAAMYSVAKDYCTYYSVNRPTDYGNTVSEWKMISSGEYANITGNKGCGSYDNLIHMKGPKTGSCGGETFKAALYWTGSHNNVYYFCKDMNNGGQETPVYASTQQYARACYKF